MQNTCILEPFLHNKYSVSELKELRLGKLSLKWVKFKLTQQKLKCLFGTEFTAQGLKTEAGT